MKSKNLKISSICEKICELEAYYEYLEDRLNKNLSPFTRKTDKNQLLFVKRKLSELYSKL